MKKPTQAKKPKLLLPLIGLALVIALLIGVFAYYSFTNLNNNGQQNQNPTITSNNGGGSNRTPDPNGNILNGTPPPNGGGGILIGPGNNTSGAIGPGGG
jgi:hypothetical protein